MSYQIEALHDKQVLLVTMQGQVSLEIIFAYIDDLCQEPYLSLPYGILIDYRQASMSGRTPADVEQIFDYLLGKGDQVLAVKQAMVVSRTFDFGMSRMFQLMSEEDLPLTMLITDDFDEAMTWVSEEK